MTVKDNTFAYNALAGMAAYNPNCTIEGNTFAFNGEKGLTANAINGSLIEGNAFAYNNQDHFADDWDAAGVKICNSSNVTVKDNLSDSNLSIGYWFDIHCSGTTIVGNVSKNDAAHGIHYELSNTAIIASNLVVGSHGSGINVGAGSSDVRVYNNTLVGNYRDIRVTDDDRPENTLNVTIRNNILSNGDSDSSEMVMVQDYSSSLKTAKQMNVTLDYNAYYRTSSSKPSVLVHWSLGSRLAAYNHVNAFRSGAGQEETHGFGIDNVAINPFFVNEASGDYHLKPGSPAIGAGVPLPADVAAAIGVTAGVPVNLGVLTW